MLNLIKNFQCTFHFWFCAIALINGIHTADKMRKKDVGKIHSGENSVCVRMCLSVQVLVECK